MAVSGVCGEAKPGSRWLTGAATVKGLQYQKSKALALGV